MALSEHEQRMFAELERELLGEGIEQRGAARGGRWLLGLLIFAAGLAGLIVAVATQLTVFGAVGFVAMLAGLVVALGGNAGGQSGDAGSKRFGAGPTGAPKSAKAPRASRSGSFFEDRWDRRQGN
jgi:hypothetical protein